MTCKHGDIFCVDTEASLGLCRDVQSTVWHDVGHLHLYYIALEDDEVFGRGTKTINLLSVLDGVFDRG